MTRCLLHGVTLSSAQRKPIYPRGMCAAGLDECEANVNEGTPTQTASRFYERFDGSDIDAMLSVFSPDLETTDPGMGTVHGVAPFREDLETLKRAMPDARAVIERIFEAGDAAIVEGRLVGTFTGPLSSPEGDVAPNGAKVDLRFADVSRIRDGEIFSYHTYYDQLGMLTQLGLMGTTAK